MNTADDLTARIQHIASAPSSARARQPRNQPWNHRQRPGAASRMAGRGQGCPGQFLASALFPAIQGKDAASLEAGAHSRAGGAGNPLHGLAARPLRLEVWQKLVHRARLETLGHRIQFTAHALLQAAGPATPVRAITSG